MIITITEFKKTIINESSISDLNNYLETKSKKIGRFDIEYNVSKNNSKNYIEVSAHSKRGLPKDAFLTLLSVSKPTLLDEFEYVTGIAVSYNDKPVTKQSIKEDDENYDDREYTDSEFSGSVLYEIKEKK
jgi:hypothetical protein